VLRYLAERPGQVVSGQELLREVWGEIVVTRAVLKVAVCAVREALGDEVARPRYIETVGREGYRFLGKAGGTQIGTTAGVSSSDTGVVPQ
jgi:DNA-binding winged helix-turn-helix (wHTH) protein